MFNNDNNKEMKNIVIKNKDRIKYQVFIKVVERWNGPDEIQEYKITGIGQKAIKYQLNGKEDDFVFYNQPEAFRLMRIILTSFDNEYWNEDIRQKAEAQAKYAKEAKAPRFAPEDGICYSCGKQIYNKISLQTASSDLITGCPHCKRSYCD